jgi:hypothetical protein
LEVFTLQIIGKHLGIMGKSRSKQDRTRKASVVNITTTRKIEGEFITIAEKKVSRMQTAINEIIWAKIVETKSNIQKFRDCIVGPGRRKIS